MGTIKDLTGEKFGQLSVVEFAGLRDKRKSQWRCLCECGKELIVPGAYLTTGSTKSCGCYRKHLNKLRNPKNKYEIDGSMAKFFVPDYKGNIFECLIDKDQLEEVRKRKWFTKYSKSSGYYYVQSVEKENGVRRVTFLHRLLTKAPKGMVVDHKNHNTMDNRLGNLRVCTHSENAQNRRSHTKRNKSGVRNVSWDPRNKKWKVDITVNKKRHYMGLYVSLEEAKRVAEEGRKRYLPFAT